MGGAFLFIEKLRKIRGQYYLYEIHISKYAVSISGEPMA